jgi:hypothetical protein
LVLEVFRVNLAQRDHKVLRDYKEQQEQLDPQDLWGQPELQDQ